MADFDFDLFVVGGGSGGVRAARRAASLGARVALAERGALGGTCVNIGCVPKKLFHHASAVSHQVQDAQGFGWTDSSRGVFDWQTLLANKNAEIARLNGAYETTLAKAGVRLLRGSAALAGAQEIRLQSEGSESRFTAERILLATGVVPMRPKVQGGVPPGWVSDDLFHLQALPESLVIFGGGYIACEFAGIFHGLGVQTTLIHRSERLMRGFDLDAVQLLIAQYEKSGLRVLLESPVESVAQVGESYETRLAGGRKLTSAAVLWATGRTGNTQGLGLEAVGVETGAEGKVLVDAAYRTSVASIFALGDLASRGIELTPVAIAEAEVFVRQVFGSGAEPLDYSLVASAAFTSPPVARVGLLEEEARLKYGDELRVWQTRFNPLRLALSERSEPVFMKLLAEPKAERIVGVHLFGEEAPELIQVLAAALTAGVTKADLDKTIAVHPTVAEELVTLG